MLTFTSLYFSCKCFLISFRETEGSFKSTLGKHIDPQDECTELKEYFLTLFTQDGMSSLPEHAQLFTGGNTKKINEANITRKEVVREINKLKKPKSPGPDDILQRVLKERKDIIDEPLVRI